MCAHDRDEELEDEFESSVRRERARIERGRAQGHGSFWRYLGLIGVVGWSVVVPTVVGALVGLWLDERYGTGYRLTLGLIVFGLAMGCLNAWRMITRER